MSNKIELNKEKWTIVKAWIDLAVYGISFIAMIGLFIAGFILPPTGQIDSSVFTAGGFILAAMIVAALPSIIEKVGIIKLSKGDTSVEIKKDEE